MGLRLSQDEYGGGEDEMSKKSRQESGQAMLVERQKWLDEASEHLLSASSHSDKSRNPALQAEEAAKILKSMDERRFENLKSLFQGQASLRDLLSLMKITAKT